MAKLLVRDKNGVEREMTQQSFDLAGQKRGWTKIGTVPEPETEVQRIMREKKEERAAQNQQAIINEPQSEVPEQKKTRP